MGPVRIEKFTQRNPHGGVFNRNHNNGADKGLVHKRTRYAAVMLKMIQHGKYAYELLHIIHYVSDVVSVFSVRFIFLYFALMGTCAGYTVRFMMTLTAEDMPDCNLDLN